MISFQLISLEQTMQQEFASYEILKSQLNSDKARNPLATGNAELQKTVTAQRTIIQVMDCICHI